MRHLSATHFNSGTLVISGLGVVFLALWFGYLLVNQHYAAIPPWLLVVGAIPALALAAGLVYGGYWLHRNAFTTDIVWEVASWCFVGIAGTTAVMFSAMVYQWNVGVAIGDPLFLLLMSGGVGANAGILIGVYNAHSLRHVRQVQRARDTLAFLNRALRHNVLNASNIIQGYAAQIAERHPVGRTATYANLIQKRSEHVVHHVDNVRLFARRLENRRSFETVAVGGIVERELDVIRETHDGAIVESELQADVDVRVDDLFAPLIAILVDHAIGRCDRDPPHVAVTLSSRDGRATLRVGDTGPGLTDAQKARLFEPGEHGESGLDMYLVSELVSDYGGDVAVEDNVPRGAVVAISLPTVD